MSAFAGNDGDPSLSVDTAYAFDAADSGCTVSDYNIFLHVAHLSS